MKKAKISVLIAVMLLMVTFVAGCSPKTVELPKNPVDSNGENVKSTAYPKEIVDSFGNTVTINEKPKKVVSVSPSQTEILFTLGLKDQIVGVSDYCDYPAEALEKEKIGSAFAVNVEKILELDPEIVFLYNEAVPEAIEQIKAAGIHVLIYSPETTEEIFNTISDLGSIMGVETKAEEIIHNMKAKKDEIVNKVKDLDKVRTFYQVWDEPLMTAGVGSFIHELITLAGGENVAVDGEGAYPQYSVEAMIEKNPQVYLAPAHTLENFTLSDKEAEELKSRIKSRPGYDTIDAVKNDRIELLEPNIVSRPGVRIIEALELIAKALHPEAF